VREGDNCSGIAETGRWRTIRVVDRGVSKDTEGAASTRVAEEIYSDFLRGGLTDGADFSELCARHAEHADALRFLRSFHGSLEETLSADGSGASVARALDAFLASSRSPAGSAADGDGDDAAHGEARASYAMAGPKRFEVIREVGRGGMSVVFEVRDPDLDRTLALKVLAPGAGPLHDRLALALRFLREARIVSRLEHPGVVPVHEVGVDPSGHVFFTMPLVRGKTLHEVLEERRRGEGGWTLERLTGILARVCQTLSYAHSRGVVHRDLKPSNVMVGSFGETFVMDWGLASEPRQAGPAADAPACLAALGLDADGLATQPGAVVGTPAYMPPEQAQGRAADERSDVYAAGAILYTILAGRIPYVEPGSRPDSRAIVAAVLAGPPAPLDRVARAAPAELVAVCERAMAREPEARYASMRDLGADLEAFLQGRVVRAHRTGALAELQKWVRRNRAAALAGTAAVLAVAGGLAAAAFLEGRARVEIVRLGDLHILDELKAEVQVLEPVLPRDPGACIGWLGRVDAVYGRLGAHRESLARLRERGKRVLRRPKEFPHQLPLAARHRELREEVFQLEREALRLNVFARHSTSWQSPAILAARRRSVKLAIDALRSERERIGARLVEIGHWEFASRDDQWLHDQLASIVMELDLLQDHESHGALRRFQRRLEIAQRCRDEAAARWREAIEAVAAHPAYRGFRLALEYDLLPLGPDPDSGLWEFAHPESGEVPVRDAQGRLVLRDDSCIVLVLVPGCAGPKARGARRQRLLDAAFLIAKHEMTQAQWRTLTGRNPSHFAAGVTAGGREITARHPVEGISQDEALRVLRRSGLQLPRRVQWMHCAAAGQERRWPPGDEERSLAGHANLRDRTSAAHGGFGSPEHEEWLDDGYFLHAPVGSYRPNGYGLHDTAGNVREWCRGAAVEESQGPADFVVPRDGLETAGVTTARPAVGGAFCDLAEEATISNWLRMDTSTRSGSIGLRPSRDLAPGEEEPGDGHEDG